MRKTAKLVTNFSPLHVERNEILDVIVKIGYFFKAYEGWFIFAYLFLNSKPKPIFLQNFLLLVAWKIMNIPKPVTIRIDGRKSA